MTGRLVALAFALLAGLLMVIGGLGAAFGLVANSNPWLGAGAVAAGVLILLASVLYLRRPIYPDLRAWRRLGDLPRVPMTVKSARSFRKLGIGLIVGGAVFCVRSIPEPHRASRIGYLALGVCCTCGGIVSIIRWTVWLRRHQPPRPTS